MFCNRFSIDSSRAIWRDTVDVRKDGRTWELLTKAEAPGDDRHSSAAKKINPWTIMVILGLISCEESRGW